jgi:hypothetical protein
MPEPVNRFFKSFGVTPWQLVLGTAAIGSWWATIQPLPGQLALLNQTVQQISTKVEVHSVMLNEMKELRQDMNEFRKEFSAVEVRLAAISNYKAP